MGQQFYAQIAETYNKSMKIYFAHRKQLKDLCGQDYKVLIHSYTDGSKLAFRYTVYKYI